MAGYTSPSTGSVEELLLWDSNGESAVSWGSHTSGADSCYGSLPDSMLTLSRSMSAVASHGNMSHNPYKGTAEDLERL